MLGIDESVEDESHDRTSIDLPACQHSLAAAILALNKPTAIVLLNGGMLAVEQEKASAAAIIEGVQTKTCSVCMYADIFLARVRSRLPWLLWGRGNCKDHLWRQRAPWRSARVAHVSAYVLMLDMCAGKLTYTVYPADYIKDIKMSDMELTTGPGRTYRYYQGTPLWSVPCSACLLLHLWTAVLCCAVSHVRCRSFGHGLAYTTFSVSAAHAPLNATFQTADTTYHFRFDYEVKNIGNTVGDEVVQAYMRPVHVPRPHANVSAMPNPWHRGSILLLRLMWLIFFHSQCCTADEAAD